MICLNYKKNKSSGFTLIELILYVALVFIILTGVVTFGVNVIQLRTKSRVEQEVTYNTRLVSKRIMFEIRNASAINSVAATTISLANSDSARNPTVIAKTGKTVTIGWGSAGSCSTTSPCTLTSNEVDVQNLTFTNYSDAGNKSANIKFEMAVKSAVTSGGQAFYYSQYATGSGEVRAK